MSGPHTGVFGRKDLCNSRIYLLHKDAEINVALWIISCRSIVTVPGKRDQFGNFFQNRVIATVGKSRL